MSRRVKLLVFSAFFLLVDFSLPSNVPAQTAAGRIIGTVSDPQGAAVAGAKVTVTNTATGAQWETTTNAEGAYQVLDLPIGT